jgi:hypothetical protein
VDNLAQKVKAIIDRMRKLGIPEAEYADITEWSEEDMELFVLTYEDYMQENPSNC